MRVCVQDIVSRHQFESRPRKIGAKRKQPPQSPVKIRGKKVFKPSRTVSKPRIAFSPGSEVDSEDETLSGNVVSYS